MGSVFKQPQLVLQVKMDFIQKPNHSFIEFWSVYMPKLKHFYGVDMAENQ